MTLKIIRNAQLVALRHHHTPSFFMYIMYHPCNTQAEADHSQTTTYLCQPYACIQVMVAIVSIRKILHKKVPEPTHRK